METQVMPYVTWTRMSLWYVNMAVSGLHGLTVWSESAPSVGFSGFLFRRATHSNWHPALEKLTSGQHQGSWEPDRISGGQETIVLPKGKSRTNILLPRLHRSWSIPPGRFWKNLYYNLKDGYPWEVKSFWWWGLTASMTSGVSPQLYLERRF